MVNDAMHINRRQIAQHAGVRKTAVSNWLSRHPDFPRPALGGDDDLFDAYEVALWLDRRPIPAGGLLDGERKGQTYGDRFRHSIGLPPSPNEPAPRPPTMPQPPTMTAAWDLANLFRDELDSSQSLIAVASLIYLAERDPQAWTAIRERREMPPINDTNVPADPYSILARLDRQTLRRAIEVVDRAVEPTNTSAAELFTELTEQHARRLGRRTGEHFTPRAIVEAAVSLLAPLGPAERIYDPFCRTGEFLNEFVSRTNTDRASMIVRGRHPDSKLSKLAQMNLTLCGVTPRIDTGYWWDDHTNDRYDLVLTNPPFNARLPHHAIATREWRYGEPPPHNANFAWAQHVIDSLAPGGRAAMIMPNNAGQTVNPREKSIRAAMLKDGAVECVISLPSHLFYGTSIPVSVWLLRAPSGIADGVLFVDATRLGSSLVRGHRDLTRQDQNKIVNVYQLWRDGKADPRPGFARYASLDEIRERDYVLAPSVYIEPADVADGSRPSSTRIAGLVHETLVLSRSVRDISSDIELLLATDDPSTHRRWPATLLKDLCELKAGPSGSDSRPADHIDDGVPVVLAKQLRDGVIGDDDLTVLSPSTARRLHDYRLETDDVVLVRTGGLGRVARVRPHHHGWLLSAGLVRLRSNGSILPAYLVHALSTKAAQGWIARNSSGTTVPAITVKALGRLPLAVPPLERQRQIANALDALTDQVGIYRNLAENTDAIRALLTTTAIDVPYGPSLGHTGPAR